MSNIIRDAPIGQLIRYVTGNKVFQYPEEKPDFVLPDYYSHTDAEKVDKQLFKTVPSLSSSNNSIKDDLEKDMAEQNSDLHLTRTQTDRSRHELSKTNTIRSALSRVGSRIALEQSKTRADLEQAFAVASEPPSWPETVVPVRTSDGTILVDWYTTDDKANPQNWSNTKKGLVTLLICIYTTAVYTGSAIYTPSAEGVMERFGVSATSASLGIALFVFAYGLGPLLFSPLSEIPKIGRNPPYIITFAIFTILCVPTALADNFAGLMVLRFLQGFFGSPILATGGASLQDMFSLIKLPYVLCCWAAAACIGPALGPIISGFSVAAMNWRWSLWEILWLAAPVWITLFLFLPETYPETILLRRAQRLRALTGNQNLKAQSEINQAQRSFNDMVVEALWRPIQLIALDPAIVSQKGPSLTIHPVY
jgi:DHA1 family multidrug resistance protein-like MFS transporter